MILDLRTIDGPIGPITLLALDDALVACEFADKPERCALGMRHLERFLGALTPREHADPAGAATRLERYFAGERGALDAQPVALHGTPFQLEVWNALRGIPAGRTRTYAALAERIGRPQAVRAVGAANGANPIALFVPCHRVIAANGTLWGYGGGLERKRWLLAHEGAAFVDPPAQGALALEGETARPPGAGSRPR